MYNLFCRPERFCASGAKTDVSQSSTPSAHSTPSSTPSDHSTPVCAVEHIYISHSLSLSLSYTALGVHELDTSVAEAILKETNPLGECMIGTEITIKSGSSQTHISFITVVGLTLRESRSCCSHCVHSLTCPVNHSLNYPPTLSLTQSIHYSLTRTTALSNTQSQTNQLSHFWTILSL